jgi:hypothetical protein
MIVVAVVATALFGLTLLAAGPFSGSWSNEVLVEVGTSLFKSLDSVLHLDYSFGGLVATSESEIYLAGGFVWQGFGMSGRLGAFDIQTDVLFGPSTSDFIYSQAIVTTSLAGVDLGFYFAQLSDAVLGGPASGVAFRLAGSVGAIDVVSVTEFGARIQDDDVDGITIYHAATGLYKSYVTNPIVPVTSDSTCTIGGNKGFTGEKVSLSGLSFGCVEDIGTTLYITKDGFDSFTIDLTGIDIGIAWLALDFELVFTLDTKSLALTPTFVVGEAICIDTYLDVLTNAASITGIEVYGFGLVYSWNGVTVKDLTVLDTGRYAITTPEYGSVIEEIATALDEGHDVYSDYWELLSIEVTRAGCCGGDFTFLANTYFSKTATSLFSWGMTYVEAKVPFGSSLFLSGSVAVEASGLEHVGFGVGVKW